MCLCSVLDWCSQSWVQLNSELWRRLVPRWQHWPLRSCRRWEMTDGKTTLASGTFYHAAVWFLLVPLWLSFLIIIPGVCVSWRFLRICKLLVKRWGIKCHVAHITFPCSSNWRGRKMFLGSVSSAFCSSPLCFCYPTGFTVSCMRSCAGGRLSSHHWEQTVQNIHRGDFQQRQVGQKQKAWSVSNFSMSIFNLLKSLFPSINFHILIKLQLSLPLLNHVCLILLNYKPNWLVH